MESEEYAVIANVGGSPVNLGGWRLNADDAGQDFFPADESLLADDQVIQQLDVDHLTRCKHMAGHFYVLG